jgi:hypothetical protein
LSGLFTPELRRTTLVTAGLSACAYAAAFGALQLTPLRVIPGVPELSEQRAGLKPLQDEAKALNVEMIATNARAQDAFEKMPALRVIGAKRAKNRIAFRSAMKAGDKAKADQLNIEFKDLSAELEQLCVSHADAKTAVLDREKLLKQLGDNREKQEPFDLAVKARANSAQLWQEFGGLAGRIALALLVVLAVARGTLLRIFLGPGLIAVPLTYFGLYASGGQALNWGIALCGLLIVAQFSYFGEFLPKVFPLHLRGTGGSFATNVGGRMIGTSAAFLTTNIVAPMVPGNSTFDKVAFAAGIVGTSVFVIGFLLSFLLPKPPADDAAPSR